MEKYVNKCVDFILEGVIDNEITTPLLQTVPRTNLNLVMQLCSLLEAVLSGEQKVSSMQVRQQWHHRINFASFHSYMKHVCFLANNRPWKQFLFFV